jgi:Ca-activated chloride channel family protein
MDHTYADVEEGVRCDVEVEFVTRRAVDVGDARVHRLLVADRTDTQFAVLVAPDRDVLSDLKTGETYRLAGLLGAGPPRPTNGRTCPDCGGAVRPGGVVDTVGPAVARAAARLDLDDRFGVVDDLSVVGEPATGGWRPMACVDRPGPPALVCTACGHGVGTDELDDPLPTGHGEAAVDAAAAPAGTGVHERVAAGLTPRPEEVCDASLFADCRVETARDGVAPRYAAAASDHPLDGGTEWHLSVELDAALPRDAVERPRFDLVVALDVSGSMDGAVGADTTTKLAAAKRAVSALTEQLRPTDRLGVVLFDHRAHVARPLDGVGSTDLAALRRRVDGLSTGGGTDLAGGFDAAVDLLADAGADPTVERRTVVLTDETVGPDLVERAAGAAARGVHATVVGLGSGVDTGLSAVRGATVRTVDSAAAAERLLGADLAYVVAPLAFDLTVDLDTTGFQVAAVHGSPAARAASDRLVDVGTLFPRPPSASRGGVVLVRLARTAGDPSVDLVSSWTERDGATRTDRRTVEVPTTPGTFGNDAVRTAVALSRCARELRAWARSVYEDAADDPVPLTVDPAWAERFDRLRSYLVREAEAVGDDRLRREVDLLDRLCRAGD